MSQHWEIYALKYATHAGRPRLSNFIFDSDPHGAGDIDFFVWVLKSGDRTILIDTGFDQDEAARRGRNVYRSPLCTPGVLVIKYERAANSWSFFPTQNSSYL